VRIEPLQSGGGQERGIRSGTVPTPLVVGIGAACALAQEEMEVSVNPQHFAVSYLIFSNSVQHCHNVRVEMSVSENVYMCHVLTK